MKMNKWMDLKWQNPIILIHITSQHCHIKTWISQISTVTESNYQHYNEQNLLGLQ